MSVLQPGGDKRPGGSPGDKRPGGSPGDKRPGGSPGGGRPSAPRRPPSAKPGSGGAGRGPQRPAGAGPAGKASAKGASGRRVGTPVSAGPPRRMTLANAAYAVIALVVVVVVALVVVKVTGGGSGSGNSLAPKVTPAPASVVAAVTGIPTSVENAVGVPPSSLVVAPRLAKNQPVLTSAGKPEVLFIGALFCPYCAAMRWPIVAALSRFGTFSGLKETTSSPWDTDPSTATLAFDGASYTSRYIVFDGIEHEGNDTNGLGTHTQLQPLTSTESNLWAKYAAMFSTSEGFPFMDIGNTMFVLGPLYNPAILSGLNQQDIASRLTNPDDQVTKAIVGTANYLTAGICSITGQQPASVCTQPAVTQADKALGLGS
jgi:hypothetical protein